MALAWVMLVAAVLVCASAAARAADPEFLPPEKAFTFSAVMTSPDLIELRWGIAPGYYMYREQFRFETVPASTVLGEPQIPPGKIKFDLTFNKDVETYRDSVTVRVPVGSGSAAGVSGAAAQPLTLVATAQGCADAGLCYPPTQYTVKLASIAGGYAMDDGLASRLTRMMHSDDVGLADLLAGGGLLQTVLVFFVLGVLLSLTPCVLPMVPILSSILVGDNVRSARPRLRGLGLAAVYVAGMSVVYTAVGVAAGLSGESLAAALQGPWVLGAFALLLAVLALAMFDVFTLQLPVGVQTRLSARMARLPAGRATGALAMGAISALIVGPCVAAPLAGALLYISQTRDVVLGGLALFALAWGMGVPLLLAGASAGALVPRAGAWMDGVKRFFGMLLLAVAWWMLTPVLSGPVQMAGWGVLAVLTAALLHAFDALPAPVGVGQRMVKGVGVLFALLGVLQWVGVASGGRDPWTPLAHLAGGQYAAGDAGAGRESGAGVATGKEGLDDELAGAASSAQAALGAAVQAPSMSVAPGASPSGGWQGAVDGSTPGMDVPPGSSAMNGTTNGITGNTPGSITGRSSANDASSAASRALPGAPVLKPVARKGAEHFEQIRTLAELDALVAASDRPVMLDFYADWCVSCKEMEAFTFPKPEVVKRLANIRMVQVDVTANNADDKALLKRFSLFGPPGIVFFRPGGEVIRDVRVIGFQNAERFAGALDKVLAISAASR
jgi:thiol:disulfide interchange protein DsbD